MLAGSAQLTGLTEWRADTSAALKTTLKPHSHHGSTVIHSGEERIGSEYFNRQEKQSGDAKVQYRLIHWTKFSQNYNTCLNK